MLGSVARATVIVAAAACHHEKEQDRKHLQEDHTSSIYVVVHGKILTVVAGQSAPAVLFGS